MEISRRLVRHCPPSRFDNAPTGTIWCQWVTKDHADYFMQTSEDPQKPQWEKMSSLLETAFEQFFTNDSFMDECLQLYKNNKPLKIISEIIKEKD